MLAFLVVLSLSLVNGCTLIAVGRKATADGSCIVAHTDDAGGGASDVRLVKVPAAEWPEGSMRPVYNFHPGYPRVVTKHRGPIYEPKDDQEVWKPIGHIPQVKKTYGYFDQDYGLQNEVQLTIAETSCGARTVGWCLDKPWGKNLLSIAELSRIALERCDSARCAIKTMGHLGEKYGYFDEDSGTPEYPGYTDSSETLGISDRYGEVWIFSILTGADGFGAIWAAQRVGDDQIAAAPNVITIRQMDLDDKDHFMASENVRSVAIQMGWWDPKTGPFDFAAAYAYTSAGPIIPYYSGRRIWRIFDLAAPSLKLSPYLGEIPTVETYPFSIRPEKPVTVQFLQSILRDHFEGTEFDMTKGLGAGPFGNPVRFDGPTRNVTGGWERSISIYRASFSFVAQSRPWLPDEIGGIFWYGHDAPHGTVYVPFYGAQTYIPKSYLNCKESEFSRDCTWWAFNFVNNWIGLRYNAMIVDVKAAYTKLEEDAFERQHSVEERILKFLKKKKDMIEAIDKYTNDFAERVTKEWWALGDKLISKYSDGYMVTGELPSEMRAIGYPEWWLRATEFHHWPHHELPSYIPRIHTSTPPIPAIPPSAGQPEPAPSVAASFSSLSESDLAYWRGFSVGFVCIGVVITIITLTKQQYNKRRLLPEPSSSHCTTYHSL
jgi:dipeptidase